MGWVKRGLAWMGGRREGPVRRVGDVDFVVLDTELTGLDPRKDEIVSIGAVRMHGGDIAIGGTFHEWVRPQAPMDGRSVLIHGITPSQLEEMPPIAAVLEEFKAYSQGHVLVGYCLAIDVAFLEQASRGRAQGPWGFPAVDTLSLYGWLRAREIKHPAFALPLNQVDLFTLGRSFGMAGGTAHEALADAYLTAQIFQRFLPLLASEGVEDLDELLRVGDPRAQGENLVGPAGRANF